MTANNPITDLLGAQLDPDWTAEGLAEQLLSAIAAQSSEEAREFVFEADATTDRQSRRLLRPLLACLATKSAAEAGTPANLYSGQFSFKRPGSTGPVWIFGRFENRPGSVRVTLRRSSSPPEGTETRFAELVRAAKGQRDRRFHLELLLKPLFEEVLPNFLGAPDVVEGKPLIHFFNYHSGKLLGSLLYLPIVWGREARIVVGIRCAPHTYVPVLICFQRFPDHYSVWVRFYRTEGPSDLNDSSGPITVRHGNESDLTLVAKAIFDVAMKHAETTFGSAVFGRQKRANKENGVRSRKGKGYG